MADGASAGLRSCQRAVRDRSAAFAGSRSMAELPRRVPPDVEVRASMRRRIVRDVCSGRDCLRRSPSGCGSAWPRRRCAARHSSAARHRTIADLVAGGARRGQADRRGERRLLVEQAFGDHAAPDRDHRRVASWPAGTCCRRRRDDLALLARPGCGGDERQRAGRLSAHAGPNALSSRAHRHSRRPAVDIPSDRAQLRLRGRASRPRAQKASSSAAERRSGISSLRRPAREGRNAAVASIARRPAGETGSAGLGIAAAMTGQRLRGGDSAALTDSVANSRATSSGTERTTQTGDPSVGEKARMAGRDAARARRTLSGAGGCSSRCSAIAPAKSRLLERIRPRRRKQSSIVAASTCSPADTGGS